MDLREGINQSAAALGVDPVELATAISYETAGTFSPTKLGPTTQHGQHRGLIQWGEPQAQKYAVDWADPVRSQLGPEGAVVKYLRDAGVQPGMGLLDIYSAINAGGVGLYDRSDAHNGGAPGTVRDKVEKQMSGHRRKALAFLGGDIAAPENTPEASGLPAGLTVPHSNPTPRYLSDREIKAAEVPQASLLEGVGAAIKSEWAGSWALAQMGGEDFKPDEDFRYSDELWKELTDGLPEDYHSMFDDAVSLAHARSLREQADAMVATDQKLASLGGWGTALRIGAAVTDPIAIGASILTEGVAAPAIFGAKATRLGRALRAGASAGIANAAVEGYIASQDPTRGAADVLLAGATGLAVGGALGAFIPTKMDLELEKVARSVQREFATQAGDNRSMGAAYVGTEAAPVLSAAERQLAEAADAPRSALGGARIDMVGRLKQSPHPIVRRLAGALAEDGVGNADGSVLARSASENVSHAMKTRMTMFYRKAEPAFKDWAKAKGIPLWKRAAHRENFFEEVGLAVRREPGFYTTDPNVNKVADAMRSMQADLLRFAQEKNLRGFDQVTENSQYMMRVFHHRRLDELTTRFGGSKLNRMVANSIMRASDGFEYEEALDVAQAYLKSIRSQKYQDVQLSRVFSEDQADLLEEILMSSGDIPADRIANITASVRKPQTAGEEGRNARGKRRLRLDETYRETYVDANGASHTVGIEDFLDNNAERLMTLYTRQISGAGFMEEALSEFKVPRLDGGVDEYAPSFETIKQHIRDTAGELEMKPKALEAELDKLDVLYKSVMGIPLSKQTAGGEALRMLRDYNFVRVMNQVGFAQVAEIGNILGATGWRATLQHVPALRNIYKRAQNGAMSDELLDEIEVIWGIGTDRLRRSYANRMDDYGVYEGAGLGKADNALQTAKHITADISFMAPVNTALQRMAGRAAVQRWMNMATGSKPFSKSRLASMGVDEDMAARINQQMLDHVDTREGMLGRAVKRINIDDWVDEEAATAFVNAIDRWSRKVIQENDIGQMSKWMTTDLGKTAIQFRSFMVAAWAKQTLTGIQHRDWDTFVMWSTSILFGGLSYTAQTHINAIGRDDRKEYLQERLNASALGRSAFQRAGFSTIVPGAVDSLVQAVGYEPVFAYGRSTGLASNAFLGNPTTDLMDKGVRAIQGVTAAAARSDYDYSQQDWRALTSITPFQNAMVLRNAYNMLGQRLPTWSE
jgi:hypothetical protein